MSYVIVALVLATLFGLDAYETALAIFIAAFLIHAAERSRVPPFDNLRAEPAPIAPRVPRERAPEMGPSPARISENYPYRPLSRFR